MLIDTIHQQGSFFYRHRNGFPIIFLIIGVLVWLNRDPVITQYKHPEAETLFEIFCFMISGIGIAIRVLTIGYNQAPGSISGRKDSDNKFHKTGMYSIVRHPLYLGNFFIWLGLVVYFQNGKLLFCYLLLFTVIYERVIIAKEMLLESRFGRQYKDWASVVPAFFPRVSIFRSAGEKFYTRSVLIFEAPVVFLTCLSFYVLEWTGWFYKQHIVETFWHCVFGTSILLTLVSLMLARKDHIRSKS